MRILITIPLLLAAACNMNVDQANDSVSLQYDENLAENTVETVANKAEEIGGQVVNDVQETASQVDNRVDVEGDVNVDVDGNETANAQ